MAAFRTMGSAFALTRYTIVPSPWPPVPLVNSIQAAAVDDVQSHSRAAETATCPVPPGAGKLCAPAVSVTWHREDVGAVTVVDVVAELPHATDHAAATTRAKSRARTRCTDLHNTSHAPATMRSSGACFRSRWSSRCCRWVMQHRYLGRWMPRAPPAP